MNYLTTKKDDNKVLNKEEIRMKSISFTDGESDEVTLIPTTVYTWKDANDFILQRALTKVNSLGYLKTFFEVEFEDGEMYRGRYDIHHFTKEKADLRKHIIDFALCYSGRKKPDSFKTEEEYREYLNSYVEEDIQRYYSKLLDEYELSDQTDPSVERDSFNNLLIEILRQIENNKLFDYGKIDFTFQVYEKVRKDPPFCQFMINCLKRHLLGDFGDIPEGFIRTRV